jgi:hypothetical protein
VRYRPPEPGAWPARAISVQLAAVIKGQQRSLADTCSRRSAAIRTKIGMICKQEVRSSPPGLRVPVTCLSERTITVAYGRQRRTAEEAQVGASQKIKGRPADFPSW